MASEPSRPGGFVRGPRALLLLRPRMKLTARWFETSESHPLRTYGTVSSVNQSRQPKGDAESGCSSGSKFVRD